MTRERYRAVALAALMNLRHRILAKDTQPGGSGPWTRPGTSPFGAVRPIPEPSAESAALPR